MWGTPDFPGAAGHPERFIPTGVGNTGRIITGAVTAVVHPHGCGEHILSEMLVSFNVGSSPRVWGTRMLEELDCEDVRFIPTGVGNTLSGIFFPPSTHGSSPRVWGTLAASTTMNAINAVHPHGCGEHTNHNRLMLKGKSSLEYSTDFHDF